MIHKNAVVLLLFPILMNAGQDWKKFSLNQPEDSWTSADKWKHFSSSAIITVENHYYLTRQFSVPRNQSIHYSMTLSLSVGLAKEIFDSTREANIFSWKDLIYDMAGTVVGTVLLNLTE